MEEICNSLMGSCICQSCFSEGVVEGTGLLELYLPFWGELQLGHSHAERNGDHQKKKFFINNFVEALIPFSEEHQGLLKLEVHLGWKWGR